MQKLLKGKNNYKKIICDKDVYKTYDFKHSLTLSTNQSKIHHECQKQNFTPSYKINYNYLIKDNLTKYGTSNDLFYLSNFEDSFARTRTRQKILLKDVCNFKSQQFLQKLFSKSNSGQQLSQLFEYYKYYINNPILYQKEHFKILYNFYEKKKYLQYKRLKALLDLDDERNSESQDSMNENISIDAKKSTKETTKTFYIMNLIQTDLKDNDNQSQSKAFLQLNTNLEQMLSKVENTDVNTPQKNELQSFLDRNSTQFKKKKTGASQVSSYKNTIAKNIKKESFHNSNSSLKKIKSVKPFKDLNPFKYIVENDQYCSIKHKVQGNGKKIRRSSNLSMGQFQRKTNNFNISSPKKYHKKRLNSCQTVISKHCSKEKNANERKTKKKNASDTKFIESKPEQLQLSDFKQYMKKMEGKSSQYRKQSEEPAQSSHKKLKIQHSPYYIQNPVLGKDSNRLLKQPKAAKQYIGVNRQEKKIKRKVNKSSTKTSQQKSPYKNSVTMKQQMIEENISNLKKKIRMAKESIKNSGSNSSSTLVNQHKKDKSTVNLSNK